MAGLADAVDEDVILPDHRRLRVRSLRWCEDAPVRELYRVLSPRTRYLRFFSPMPELPDSVLRLLTCVDGRSGIALLGELQTPAGEEVVALGSFGATGEGLAEVGLVVSDAWQHQGIGTVIADRVLRAAEARGFHRFVAHALWDNQGIRRVLRRVGQIVSTRTRQGVTEISFVPRYQTR
jgi:RimJ/RimL family protein N-acetyltransferase